MPARRQIELDGWAAVHDRARVDGMNVPWWRPFLRLVLIRAAFLVGTAATLLWFPIRRDFPPFHQTHARISLGTMEEMTKAVQVFGEVLAKKSTAAA